MEDKAELSQVMEYVAYLVKMSMFAKSFKWKSLLRYDLEHRKC